ncbi:TPA: hypothetical protein ACGO7O_002219 [Streptococcus suis]|nr:hypothetical protein [Streptococcus suis]
METEVEIDLEVLAEIEMNCELDKDSDIEVERTTETLADCTNDWLALVDSLILSDRWIDSDVD